MRQARFSAILDRQLRRDMLEIPIKTCLALAASLCCASAEDAVWLKIVAEPATWSDALVVANPRQTGFVLDSPAQTRLRGFELASPLTRVFAEDEIRRQVADFFTILPRPDEVTLKIDWLDKDGRAAGFTRSIHPKDGRIRSVQRVGQTTITRTVVAGGEDDAIFIHLLADQPGALSFRVTLGGPPAANARIEDRRQLILPAGAGHPAAHVWVLPFESDVAGEGNSITVRGEGEALIVWNFAAGKALDTTLANLGTRYDPGHLPPDPAKIWQGILGTQLKSAENSP